MFKIKLLEVYNEDDVSKITGLDSEKNYIEVRCTDTKLEVVGGKSMNGIMRSLYSMPVNGRMTTDEMVKYLEIIFI